MSTYDNKPNTMAINRINYDIKRLERDQDTLDKECIYFKFYDGNNIDTNYKQLIIGPTDTPYEGGFYLFKAQFPDQYPFHPPKMKTLTQGENVRKHPNLYVSGKCCFSFLGTWSGPPWTACQNPYTVAFSMRSVLTKEPLRNEPGYDKVNDDRQTIYENIIEFFNIKWAVYNVVNEIINKSGIAGTKFKCFEKQIIKHFTINFDKYIQRLEKFKDKDNEVIKSPVYGFSIKINYSDLKKKLFSLFKIVSNKVVLSKKKIEKSNIVNEQSNTELPKKKKSKRFKKGFPQVSITKYSVGDIVDINGNNCNNLNESLAKVTPTFKVIQMVYPSGRKIKRWNQI
jgi:ubiquitin-protein ligase